MKIAKIRQAERGQGIAEYGMIVGLIGLMAVSTLSSVGNATSNAFASVQTTLSEGFSGKNPPSSNKKDKQAAKKAAAAKKKAAKKAAAAKKKAAAAKKRATKEGRCGQEESRRGQEESRQEGRRGQEEGRPAGSEEGSQEERLTSEGYVDRLTSSRSS